MLSLAMSKHSAQGRLVFRPSMSRLLTLLVGGMLTVWAIVQIWLPPFSVWYDVGVALLAALLALRWRSRFAIVVDSTSIRGNATSGQVSLPLEAIDWSRTKCVFDPNGEPAQITLFAADGRSTALFLGMCSPSTQEALLAAAPRLKECVDAARPKTAEV